MTQTEQINLDELREEFVDWLRTKNADEAYSFCNGDICPAGQFSQFKGEPVVSSIGGYETLLVRCPTYHAIHNISVTSGCVLSTNPRTFGALLSRMEALDAALTT